jgi:glycosyltransferase involved in cell wall biosynthesis
MFSPLPPVRSGIAHYTSELLGELSRVHEIDVFVGSSAELAGASASSSDVSDGSESDPRTAGGQTLRGQTLRGQTLRGQTPSSGWTARSAHEFVWARERTPYDLVVYQMGNASCHDYMWPYLFRWPGLTVLHDGHLHHARAWSLLRRGRQDDYREELRFNHPAASADAAEIALSGFAGPVYYFWPMLRAVIASSRAVAVHTPSLAGDLRQAHSETAVHVVPMGVSDPAAAGDRAAIRRRHGFTDDTVVVAAFGAVTAEKRIAELMTAFAVARAYQPEARLLLVGQPMAGFDAMRCARDLGIAGLVTVTGYVADAELSGYLLAADVISALRWPTARETSASWIRALGAGRATIISDLAQHGDVPALDPRSWTLVHARPTQAPLEPVAVSIDLLDETHSLTRALKRLVTDAGLRARLGEGARRHWVARHTLRHMAAAYEAAIADAAVRSDPATPIPAHLRADGADHTRALLAGLGVADPLAR